MRIDVTYFVLILPLLAACGADQPATTNTDATSSTTNMTEEESGTPTSSETGAETETGEPPTNVCDTCTEDEMCVAHADDACDEDVGYTLSCVPLVASCENGECDPDCLDEVCGNYTCPPPCGNVPGVDVWCSGEPLDGCTLMDQNCPEGEKCVAYGQFGGQTSWDSTKCVPVTGDNMVGEACMTGGVAEGTDDCDESGMCFGYDAQLTGGSCYGFCDSNGDCPDGQSCLVASQNVIALCLDECVPHHPDNCGPELPCLEYGDVYACVPLVPTLPPDSPCTPQLEYCPQGQACVPAGELDSCAGQNCCTDWCDTAEPDVCDPPLSCQPYFEQGQAPAGLETAGVCKLG